MQTVVLAQRHRRRLMRLRNRSRRREGFLVGGRPFRPGLTPRPWTVAPPSVRIGHFARLLGKKAAA